MRRFLSAIGSFLWPMPEHGLRSQRGSMTGPLMAVVGGLVIFVVGIILSGIVDTTASTTGSAASIGSFTGGRSFNDLMPLLFRVGLMVVGIGLMIGGGYSGYKRLTR